MALLSSVIQRGTRASQPAATAVGAGTLYGVSDEGNIVERSNGTTWDAFSPTGAGTGDVVGPASSIDDRIATFDGTTGVLLQDGGSTIAGVLASALTAAKAAVPDVIGCSFDGGGSALTSGAVRYVYVSFAHTVTAAFMLADVSGSAVVDVWRDTYANYPPVVGDSITASAKPTLSAAIKSTDSTLTGWSTTGAAGTVYAFSLTSVSTITVLVCELTVTRT